MLQGGVGGQDGVVRLNNGCGRLGSGVDTELQLALLAIVDGQALHEQSTETRTSTTTKGVEDQETLETSAAIGDAADLVQNAINELLSNGIVSTGVVVGGVLLSGDHVLGVEQASVRAGPDLVHDVWLKIAVDGSRNILSLACTVLNASEVELDEGGYNSSHTCLGEESAEAVVRVSGLALFGQVAIGLRRDNALAAAGAQYLGVGNIPECHVQDSRAK